MPQPNPLLEALSRVAVSFHQAAPGFSGKLWTELHPWLSQLMLNAAPKWLPRLTFGFPCRVPQYQQGQPMGPCQHHAVAVCDVCGQSCCLYHARIDMLGDAICYPCIAAAVRRARGEAEPEADLAWACKTLRIKPLLRTPAEVVAAWDKIHAAHRKLCAKYHSDKYQQQPAAKKAQAEARFKEIRRAFDLLKAERDKAEKEAA